MEHKTLKARYKRTSRKQFVKQVTNIERREARFRLLVAQHIPKEQEEDFEVHHRMGKSQSEYEHIGTFLSSNATDPAFKVVLVHYFLII